jgi:opacity protein-like surface antigen
MENRRFKSTASAFGPVGLPADTARNTLSFSTNKTAFAPGVGVQTNLTKNITGTLEYRVALYGKVSRTLANPDANNVTTVFRFKPRVSTVLASFRYHF